MRFTSYRSLYAPLPSARLDMEWPEVVRYLSIFVTASDKFSVPGFGAHVLSGTTRRAASVERVTAFVFDVDAGTPDDVAACRASLKTAGLAAHFYSSYSNAPGKPAFRLLIPPNREMTPAEYGPNRAHLIEVHGIPCKVEQSGDASRFWFLPSHPPGGTPETLTLSGVTYEVRAFAPREAKPSPLTAWSPPPDPASAAVDLTPLRERLTKRATSFGRSSAPDKKRKGEVLRRILAGTELADHGARNATMLSACGLMVYALPRETTLSVLMLLIRPSLYAMVAQGSKLTEEQVERMFLTAMEKRAAADADMDDWVQQRKARKQAFDAYLNRNRSTDE